MPKTMPARPRRILLEIALVAFGILLALFSAEVAMIVFEPWLPANSPWEYDRNLGFKMRGHHAGANEFGFRDTDYPRPKPQGVLRILCLGDSFNYAGEPGRNYVEVLRRLVKQKHAVRPIDVINAGYPMTHTAEQLVILKKYALAYEPDLVILGFFAGNDFVDALPSRKRIVLNGCFYDIDQRDESFLFGYPMTGRSRLWTFLGQKLGIAANTVNVHSGGEEEARWLKPIPPTNGSADVQTGDIYGLPRAEVRRLLKNLADGCPPDHSQHPGFPEQVYLELCRDKMEFCRHDEERWRRFWKNVHYILDAVDSMHELLREKGIELAVAIFPDEFQVREDLRARVHALTGLSDAEYDIERPQRLLVQHLESRGIRHLDLLPYFREADPLRRTYNVRETHWNNFGNAVAGHACSLLVDEFLARRLPNQ